MKTVGIITEYNPFHKGHLLQIEKAKAISGADRVVVVMSGNFVQRGEPALLDKWTRTQMALLNGVDLVLELPVLYATASAEYFAMAAVKLLQDTGIVDILCFGSESGNLLDLQKMANILTNETLEFRQLLKKELDRGIVYPVARANAMGTIFPTSQNLLSSPNNILGIEYLKALSRLNSTITPITIKREGAGYHDNQIDQNLASATAIRKATSYNASFEALQHIPENCHELFQKKISIGMGPVFLQDFTASLHYCLRTMDAKEIQEVFEVTEGLENRILRSLDLHYEMKDILSYIKTKRYTQTRIQRILLHILLGIKTKDVDYFNLHGYSPYLRVLGFRKKQDHLLKELTTRSSIPVLTNLKKASEQLDDKGLFLLNMERVATDLYFMAAPNPLYRTPNQDYTTPMVMIPSEQA